jgi:acetyl-CoA carboxylase biotin carboxylase subunit
MDKPRLFHRVLIANRGEVAARIARTLDLLGIEPVFVVSTADADAAYVKGREHVVIGPGAASKSYLLMDRVIQAGLQSRCTAVHPGWGFLAENPRFATLCESHGLTFIGPPATVMHLMGKKTPAKDAMRAAGLTLIPGSRGVLANVEEARAVASDCGYPVLLKAESGGGGKGMRIARTDADVEQAFNEASAESLAAFGDSRLYLEKLVEGGRHIEIQLLADRYGNVIHLGERDCTIQRNHQKLVEESPALSLTDEERQRTLDAAVRATRSIGYVGAGTMEFLLDGDGVLRFMEMNTRLQVEHSVTEMRCGVDLVAEQLYVAAGHPLRLRQEDVALEGHAIECRINAEDPDDSFRPSPGVVSTWTLPKPSRSIRVDTHVAEGYKIPPHYDSLLCKLIAWGSDREAAAATMAQALQDFSCQGVNTTAKLHHGIVTSTAFKENRYVTGEIPGH